MSEVPSLLTHVSDLEDVARPLLRLVQYITGMETNFITSINWDTQRQEVLFALNTGAMQIPEHTDHAWIDSMCRSMLISGNVSSISVGTDVHATRGAVESDVQSFVALPILVADRPIGTVCAASKIEIELDRLQLEALQLVADALQRLISADRARKDAEARAVSAEWKAQITLAEAAREKSAALHAPAPAAIDEATGLPDMHSFTVRWEDELVRSGRRHYSVGLALIEIDGFAESNGHSGRPVPDTMLKAMAAILMGVAHRTEIVARLGPATFALVATHDDMKGLSALAEFVRRTFSNAIADLGLNATVCLGLSSSEVSPRHRLLADAELEISRIRSAGCNLAAEFAVAG